MAAKLDATDAVVEPAMRATPFFGKATILVVLSLLATSAVLVAAPEAAAGTCKGNPEVAQYCTQDNGCFSYTVLAGTPLEQSSYNC